MHKGKIAADGRPEDVLTGNILPNVYEYPLKVVTIEGRRYTVGCD
jgi:ABC-type enterochelin transport system ATPase subunit